MPPDRSEMAKEIAAQCAELEARARDANLDLLAYLLNVAREEATARATERRESGH